MTGTTDSGGANRLVVDDASAWRAWLEVNEHLSDGVRLVLAKKGTTHPTSLTYSEALEEALCSGWIDGRRNALDAHTFQQHFTPRRPRSVWSARNVGIVAGLTAAGRMRPRGLEEVDRAKADGRWCNAYEGQATAQVPTDLEAALQQAPAIKRHFEALTRADRYTIIHRIITAPTPATRTSRINRALTHLTTQHINHD